MSELLSLKKDMRKKMPKFSAQDSHKKARVKDRWRKPRGSDSKMRKQLKGYRKSVNRGYMTPVEVKDVHIKTGLRSVVVNNIEEIKVVDNTKFCVIIAQGIGKKKKLDLLNHAKDNKIVVLNVKDLDAEIKTISEMFSKRKEVKQKRIEAKEKVEKEKKKKADKKSKKKSEAKKDDDLAGKIETEEEKKAQAKKEKDKVLITKSQ